jgi:hypothetical protein
MGHVLRIRDIPDDVGGGVLAKRAALIGVSPAEYARSILEQAARRPSREELIADLSRIEPIYVGESSEQALMHIRSGRA